jgi:predicted amidohydrolase YtcJ
MKSLYKLPLALLFVAPLAHAQDTSPNTIFVHGNILTGAHLRPQDPSPTPARVTAIAVTNSTIVAVGSDADLMKLRGARTEIVDLNGAFVMPGFNDAHTHITEAGQQKLSVDLDKVTGDHPAVLYRTDGHIVVANSSALLAAGISSATPDPQGGRIDKDSSGSPTGIVRETPAVTLITSKVPPPDPETRRKAINLAIADCLAHGVTSVQNSFSDWDDWLALEAMEKDGRLNLRIAMWQDFNLPLATLKARRATHDPNDPLLHLTQLKGFMDGSLGSRTASLAAPYADDSSNSGIPRYEQAKLNEMASSRAAAGFQLGFHAIGDQANHMALNAFEAAEQVAVPATARPPRADADSGIVSQSAPAFRPRDLRFRIEHAQVLLPGDFDRFAALGVIASMQPSHLLSDMNWAGARLGATRSPYAYAWRSMLDHQITLAFGTDYPVEPISPFRGLYAAVTRKNEAGTMSFHVEQKLTIQEAIYAYTQASAYGEFREQIKGRLETGFLADFIVLDHDLMTSSPEEILHAKVLRTIVGGKTVYTAP